MTIKDTIGKLLLLACFYGLFFAAPAVSQEDYPKRLVNKSAILSAKRCHFDYNTSIDEFRKTFSLKDEPASIYNDSNRPPGLTDQDIMRMNSLYYRFETYGIWVFFTSDGHFKSLRFEAPFSGTIGGAKIGEPLSDVIKEKRKPRSNNSNGVLYNSNGYFVNYRTNRNKIFHVFTNRCD